MKYIIYVQFHWLLPDQLVRMVEGTWKEALEQCRSYKSAYPNESPGLVTMERFAKNHINNGKK